MRIAEILNSRSNSEWAHIIDEWVKSERDRKIMKRRLIDGITLEALAEEFDLSVQHTKRIINKWCAIIVKK
jgi:AraC-like DNA-binding protein